MMSIRTRLVVFCVVVSLLPAIPLSFVVRSLLEKSFNIGLSSTVEDALQKGIAVSRAHLATLHAGFERDAGVVVSRLAEASVVDSAAIERVLRGPAEMPARIDGFLVRRAGDIDASAWSFGDFSRFEHDDDLAGLAGGSHIVERAAAGSLEVERVTAEPSDVKRFAAESSETGPAAARSSAGSLRFFETENRAVQFAVWMPGHGGVGDTPVVVFYKRTDPEFLANAEGILEGRQIFAQLQLRRATLGRSFFYPFVVVYAVILLLSTSVALLTAERMSGPIRRLAEGAKAVAAGDWTHRIAVKSGGEIGALVRAFNEMVSRLDTQSRRLVDMEKMAAWREVARHLAHEIKNPLLPIRLTVQELKDQYHGEDEKYRELVDESARVVGDELDHLQNLVKEFSSFARMPDLNLRVGSLESLVRDVARLYSRITTRVEVESGLPDVVFDTDQMRRVFVNLMDNALSVAKDGEPVEVGIRLARSNGNVVLTVSDNGTGIPAAVKHKIFDPYFTTRREGSGLGLAVVKNIVLMHGGAIDAESREGEGATFRITLPLEHPVGDEPGRREA